MRNAVATLVEIRDPSKPSTETPLETINFQYNTLSICFQRISWYPVVFMSLTALKGSEAELMEIPNLQNPMCFADWFNVEKPPTEIKWEERNLFSLYCNLLGIRNRIGPQGKIYLFGIEIESSTDHDNLSWEVLTCHQWLWWIVMTCDQAVKGWRSPFPPRLKRVKKGDDGEVPEEVQRECSLLKLVWRGVLGTGVDKAKKRREFDLVVLTVAIVYIAI